MAEMITVRKATPQDLEDLLRIQRQSLPQAAEWSAGALLDGLAGCLAAQHYDRLAGFLLFPTFGAWLRVMVQFMEWNRPGIGRLVATSIGTRDAWNLRALLAATLVVAALGLVSCFIPARRAGRIDPLESLRED